MKRILFVGNFISYKTKIRQVCEELAERLVIAGWSVLTTSTKISRTYRLYDMICTIILKKNAYEVAHVDVFSGWSFFWAEAACLALRLVGRPYVLTLHGGNLPNYALRWPKRVRYLLRSAQSVTSPSNYLITQFRSLRNDIQLIPNALNLKTYQFKLRMGSVDNLIWLRAFHYIYNPTLAIRTIALILNEFPKIGLTMIGPDKGDGSLQEVNKIATDFGIIENLQIVGGIPKSEVPQRLSSGDIFFNTTNIDNTPISILEAMACGLCIISTDVGGIPYLLTHEYDALLVPPNDPEAMAAAVRRVLTEPGLAERLSRNARKKAEHYDWSVILPQWEALLTSVAQGQKP